MHINDRWTQLIGIYYFSQRNGKSSACSVVKVSDSSASRPDRLLSRIKLINSSIDDSVPRLIVIRSPKGPDGKGFSSIYRQPRLVGKLQQPLNVPCFIV